GAWKSANATAPAAITSARRFFFNRNVIVLSLFGRDARAGVSVIFRFGCVARLEPAHGVGGGREAARFEPSGGEVRFAAFGEHAVDERVLFRARGGEER